MSEATVTDRAPGALVTGGARGIGRAIAERLARRGDHVVIVDRDRSVVDTANALRGLGLDVEGIVVDVTDVAATSAVVAEADDSTPLATVVNNAGVAWSQPLIEISPERFDALMAVNLRAVFFVLQAAARAMIPRRSGVIVNLASTSAFTASTNPMVPYDTSKGAVRMLTVAAARELAGHGIRVNAVAPGTIDTDLTRGLMEDPTSLDAQTDTLIPLGRLGAPTDVAEAVAYLTSEAASYVTGHVLVVDGGWLT